jgi:excisionase family DNA binding protein
MQRIQQHPPIPSNSFPPDSAIHRASAAAGQSRRSPAGETNTPRPAGSRCNAADASQNAATHTNSATDNRPAFYTVREAARILRVGPSTLYRAIREDAFPAVRLRTRYVIPAAALDRLLAEATESGTVVDPARMAAQRRTEREIARLTGGAR